MLVSLPKPKVPLLHYTSSQFGQTAPFMVEEIIGYRPTNGQMDMHSYSHLVAGRKNADTDRNGRGKDSELVRIFFPPVRYS